MHGHAVRGIAWRDTAWQGGDLMTATAPFRRAEWLERRRGGIGGSDVAALLPATCPSWSSPWKVWGEKVGLVPPDDDPAAHLEFGRDLEPLIAKWFTARTGLAVREQQKMVWSNEAPWAFATVDGLVMHHEHTDDAIGVFEAKYTADAPWDEPPVHYVAQCQWGMYTTGLAEAWLGVMHLPFGRPRFTVYEVERDDDDIALLVAAADRFWHDNVLAGVAPEVDGSEATFRALKAAYPDHEPDTAVELDDLFDVLQQRDELAVQDAWLQRKRRRLDQVVVARLGTAEVGTLDGEAFVSYRTIHRKGYKPKPVEPTSYRVLKPASKADREAS